MMTYLGQTEATVFEVNSPKLDSGAERQEVPKEHAAVKLSGAMEKQHKGRDLATGQQGQPMESTWRNCGLRNYLAAEGLKMTAVQEWHGTWETSPGKVGPGTMLSEKPGLKESLGRYTWRARKAVSE
jgi:hypothetical protein